MSPNEIDNLNETIAQVLQQMKDEQGDRFSLEKVNLAELSRRTGISRKRLRNAKKHGFRISINGNTGRKKDKTVLTGYTAVIDNLLGRGVTNSNVVLEHLQENGYKGGVTQVKEYIKSHKYLVPAKRETVAPQGNRGRRYKSAPGEQFQMDWGFVNVDSDDGGSYRAACFTMMCHHCGSRYIEFFPNAKQENLFIGMIHAFQRLGIPKVVLTDNMKSVVNGRDSNGHPVWNRDYEAFMNTIGFTTKLCKPRHPFTKGGVERLVRFVKSSFMAGRTFSSITDLNFEAIRWCDKQDSIYHRAVDCVPAQEHAKHCMQTASILVMTDEIKRYLCPERKISFDGFVNYEGRRFGVPYRYTNGICRVQRQDFTLYIYSDDLRHLLVKHDVTWSRKDSYCKDQYVEQPEEFPSMPVRVTMTQKVPAHNSAFDRFNFDKEVKRHV
ncbi:MAG: IS21 family transposase [Prevotella sp.]